MKNLLHPEVIRPCVNEAKLTKKVVRLGSINDVDIRFATLGPGPGAVTAILTGQHAIVDVCADFYPSVEAFTARINEVVNQMVSPAGRTSSRASG